MGIRAARQAAGLSQSQLARATLMSQQNLSADDNDRRAPSPELLDRISRAPAGRPSVRVAAHREAIRELVARHHATDPRVFGSVPRGADEPGSDIDLVVDFTEDASLLDEVGLHFALRDLLQVDVVASDGLRGAFRDRVLSEAVAL